MHNIKNINIFYIKLNKIKMLNDKLKQLTRTQAALLKSKIIKSKQYYSN